MIGIEGIVGGDGWALVPGHHGAAPRRVLGVAALFGGDWRRDGGEKSRWARERRDGDRQTGESPVNWRASRTSLARFVSQYHAWLRRTLNLA